MAGYSEGLNISELKDIQKDLKEVSRDTLKEAFKKGLWVYEKRVGLDKYNLARIFNKYALDSDEYMRLHISNIILFDLDVVGKMLFNQNSNESEYNDAHLTINSSCGGLETEGIKWLVRCCPCILNDYEWSEPADIKGLLKDTVEEEVTIEGLICVYMDGDKPNTSIVPDKSNLGWAKRFYDIFDSIAFADKVVFHLLDMFPYPIKEAYIIYNGEELVGKYIFRKCKDGEYIVTIY